MANYIEVEQFAKEQLTKYNLTDWAVQRDVSNLRTFGTANSAHRIIKLNPLLVAQNSLERCQSTVLHEIAHAIVGSWNMHNGIWVNQMIAMGLEPRECFTYGVNTVAPPAKYTTNCTNCNRGYTLNRLKQLASYHCAQCHFTLHFTENPHRIAAMNAAKSGLCAASLASLDLGDL